MNTAFQNLVIDHLYELRNEANREAKPLFHYGNDTVRQAYLQRRRTIDTILDSIDPF